MHTVDAEKKRIDLTGRVCLVTGAAAGVGLEIARELALLRATVILGCADEAAGRAAVEDVKNDACNDAVSLLVVDLASQGSIREAGAKLLAARPALHVLVNAASARFETRERAVDGVERTWATNVLGPHLLTALLVDRLRASAPARIVNVVSREARGLDLDDVEFARRAYDADRAYAQSHQARRMLTWHLADRLEDARVVANAVVPGPAEVAAGRGVFGFFTAVVGGLTRRLARDPKLDAEGATWLASAPDMEWTSGHLFEGKTKLKCRFRKEADIAKLAAIADRMTGLAS